MEIFRALPKELVEEEILTQVPVKYLNGLRSTCKQWNRLFTGDRRFARKHSDKAAKQFLVLMLTRFFRIRPTIVDLDGNVPTFEVKTELNLVDPHSEHPGAQFDVGAVFHCDGLLLCTSVDESRFVVWNPLTGETRWFQPTYRPPRGRIFALGYGMKKSYKILSYYLDKKDVEIYEFSSDSWRVVGDAMPRGFTLGCCGLSVSLQGSTYLFAHDETKTDTFVSMVKFDYSSEKCVPLPLPYQLPNRRCEVTSLSVVKDEKLSLLLQRDVASKTEIWLSNTIGETTKAVSWSKVLTLDLSPDLQVFDEGSFVFDEERKVVLISEKWRDYGDGDFGDGGFGDETPSKDMIYIVGEDNVVTQVDFGLEEVNGCQAVILDYVPSLVPIERPGGKRQRADL
ncbi:unnamed protein product [Microthlaspi erraticum]|uniref:F-box domain-containing protein n=1 Tax=Microthlaspi erraticum TaxID=1685480 RepID=A0A6D2L097_9BRAS|nr:unnamed protein product [Microthlaspi erraticum]CAA7057864.1 unnamed protein product [Microthlaspi erraticum]